MQTATTSSLTADDIEILPVTTRAEMERFIRLPERLQANDKNFIPPLRFERRMAFSPKSNPLFEFTDVGFWLACRNGIDVGRISAQIERRARSEEHTSELQSLMRISYAVFCLKKKKNITQT